MVQKRTLIICFFQGIVEYLFFFPVLFIIGFFIVGPLQLWIWLISILGIFFIGLLFRAVLPQQKWWIYAVFSVVIGISVGFILGDSVLFIILLSVIHPVFIYRGMMYRNNSRDKLLPISYLWTYGFGIYFVSYFIFRYLEMFKPYLTLITVCGVAFVIVTLFISNNNQLRSVTLSKARVPTISRVIKHQNRIYLVITILLIALITNGQLIQKGLIVSMRWIIGLLSGSEDKSMEGVPDMPPSSTDPTLPFDDPGKPSVIAKFFEVIAIYVVYAVLIITLILLLLLLVKQTRIWLKRGLHAFIQFLKRMTGHSGADEETARYIDVKENIFSWKKWKEGQQGKIKGFVQQILKREPNWNSLTNQEKVRYVYRKLLLQEITNINYKTSDTPREVMQEIMSAGVTDNIQVERLIDVYEQSRYGNRIINEHVINEIYKSVLK